MNGSTAVTLNQTFTGSPTNLWFKLPFVLGPVNTSFTYTVTDTGFPAGNTGNKLTSAPATITITTPDNSSSIAWIGGTQGNDTIQVSKTTTNLVVTINGTVVSNTVPLASVTEVRPF